MCARNGKKGDRNLHEVNGVGSDANRNKEELSVPFRTFSHPAVSQTAFF